MSVQPDLEVNVGVGLNRLTQQLAAVEARMVRTANRAEAGFRRSNTRIATDFQRVTRATDDLADSTQRMTGSNGLRMVALQLSQVGQQGAVTGNYLQALSIQLPDLLLAFGTFGALVGTAAAVLTPFAMSLFNSADAADDLVKSLTDTSANLGSIRGDMDQLRDLQEKYAQAIRASADASNTTAAAVAANSKREFEARKQVLAVEIELLRIRSQENAAALRNLQDQSQIAAENLRNEVSTLSAGTRQATDAGGFAYTGPRTVDEALGASDRSVLEGLEQRRLAIRKLGAEMELTTLAIEEANTALSGEFADVAGGAASTAPSTGGGGGGGGGGRARPSRGTMLDPSFLDAVGERVTALSSATAQLDQANQAVRSSAEQAFTALITGAKDAQGAAADLLAEMGKLAASAAFRSLVGGMGGSSLISAIFGGGPSFAGGGFTGMGARAGGIDGKGGFPAVLHPNERVVDYTKGGGGMAVNVVVNIDAKGAGDSGRGARDSVDPLKRAVVAAVRDAQRRGY
jgi:hypothetical protein